MVAHLEAQGIHCWIAPRDIAPSADWAAEIIDAISAARVMILVFSANSNQSPQVRREVERAVHKQVSILPFRIEDVPPSKSLEFFLSSQHWMDAFPPPREPHYERLCSYLKAQTSQPQPTGPRALGLEGAAVRRGAWRSSVLERTGARAHRVPACRLHRSARQASGQARAARATGRADLIVRLTGELDAESDKSAFAQRCKQLPSA